MLFPLLSVDSRLLCDILRKNSLFTIVRIRQTCSLLNKVLEDNRFQLSKRTGSPEKDEVYGQLCPEFSMLIDKLQGGNLRVCMDWKELSKDENCLDQEGPPSSANSRSSRARRDSWNTTWNARNANFTVDSYLERRLSGISVHQLHIKTTDEEALQQLPEILKNLNIFFKNVKMDDIPLGHFLAIASVVEVKEISLRQWNDRFMEYFATLKQARNHSKFEVGITKSFGEEHLFHLVSGFKKFRISEAKIMDLENFITDMHAVGDRGALEEVEFDLTDTNPFSNENFPSAVPCTTVFISNRRSRASRVYICYVQLNPETVAVLRKIHRRRSLSNVKIVFVDQNPLKMLPLMISLIGLKNFTRHNEYMAADDESKTMILEEAYQESDRYY